MTFKPAHKEDDPAKKPGQIVTSPVAAVTRGESVTIDKTLTDYIARKRRQDAFDTVAQEKKLTFDEWYSPTNGPWHWQFEDKLFIECMRECWKAAQENK